MELSVYLNFNGNCEEAMNFYAQAFGTQIAQMQRFGEMPGQEVAEEDKNKVLHCNFQKDSFVLMASDTVSKDHVNFGNNVTLSLNLHGKEEADQIFGALSEGGKATMPMQDTFWGAYFGMCTDKFGVNWMFNWDKPKS